MDVSSSDSWTMVWILGGIEDVAVGGNVLVANDLVWNDF